MEHLCEVFYFGAPQAKDDGELYTLDTEDFEDQRSELGNFLYNEVAVSGGVSHRGHGHVGECMGVGARVAFRGAMGAAPLLVGFDACAFITCGETLMWSS